ncbi:S-methyl-5-thioribose-1-phosphate isomerase, partial [Candidatus Bathyarchaeota archaeon]|nr:S-methyl-5-thioribose-1-phosphate isomerase [Candidatus Bathyarchaeota archaeon]
EANRKMGAYGSTLLNDGDVILTHCNAGSLATVDYGTALGVVRVAWEQGKKI